MPPVFYVDDIIRQVGAFKINLIISGVVCFDGHWDYFAGTVTVRSFGLLQVVGASVQTLNIELTILARDSSRTPLPSVLKSRE